jgi:hypothetical protein
MDSLAFTASNSLPVYTIRLRLAEKARWLATYAARAFPRPKVNPNANARSEGKASRVGPHGNAQVVAVHPSQGMILVLPSNRPSSSSTF